MSVTRAERRARQSDRAGQTGAGRGGGGSGSWGDGTTSAGDTGGQSGQEDRQGPKGKGTAGERAGRDGTSRGESKGRSGAVASWVCGVGASSRDTGESSRDTGESTARGAVAGLMEVWRVQAGNGRLRSLNARSARTAPRAAPTQVARARGEEAARSRCLPSTRHAGLRAAPAGATEAPHAGTGWATDRLPSDAGHVTHANIAELAPLPRPRG